MFFLHWQRQGTFHFLYSHCTELCLYCTSFSQSYFSSEQEKEIQHGCSFLTIAVATATSFKYTTLQE